MGHSVPLSEPGKSHDLGQLVGWDVFSEGDGEGLEGRSFARGELRHLRHRRHEAPRVFVLRIR